jgi:D-inositol-3-phosphate glycosyltransferase
MPLLSAQTIREMPLRVAIIEPVGGHGGMDYYDFGLANGLVEAGVKVSLYTCDKTKPPAAPATFRLYRPFRAIYGDTPKIWRAAFFLAGLLGSLAHARWRGVRMVHLHLFDTSILQLACLVFAKVMGMRTVVTAHDVESLAGGQAGLLARRIYGMADRVIAHNQVSSQALVEMIEPSADKIFVIPHGNYVPNVTFVDKRVAREQRKLPNHAPVILFFGQIKQVKGLDVLLRALPAVIAKHPDVILMIAGKLWKTDLSEYSALIQQLGLESNVKLDIRYIPNEEVASYYAAADVVVLPYRKIYQSGVLLMAMSYRKAVVVSDIPGMLEIVKNGVNGFVFRSEDHRHLEKTLNQALDQPEERDRIMTLGYETVIEQHGWDHVGRLTREVYLSVLREHSSAAGGRSGDNRA